MAFPPGPRSPAILQTISLLRSGQAWIEEQARRHGDPFTVRTLIFGPQVFTSNPELIRQMFTGDPDIWHAGEANGVAKMLTGETSVLVLDGEPHRRTRRLLTPPFHGERMSAYADAMQTITEGVTEGWKARETFPLLPSLQRITLEVIVANVFGLPPGPRRDLFAARLGEFMETLASPAGAFYLIPALQHDLGPLTPWRRLKACFEELEKLIYGEIAERRARAAAPGAERTDDILALLLEVRDEDGQGMSDREIRDQLQTLLAAGHETTATSLAWAFERILAHPAVLDRILTEIDAAAAEGRTSAADLARLEYLDATVKEVLRQRPSVPMVGRRLTRPMTLGGHEIPARALVSASVHLVHRRPDLYPDPQVFRPERFLGKKMDPTTYFPFGGGPRRCLGAAFALQEMKLVLATVLRRHRLRLADPPPLGVKGRSLFQSPAGGTRVVLLGDRSN